MDIEQLQNDVRALSATDWDVFLAWVVGAERDRRLAQPVVEDAQVELVKDLADAGEITRPEVATEEAAINGDGIVPQWVDPAGKPHKAYFVGAAVLDSGRIYINRKSGLNFARPNSLNSGWEVYNPPKEDTEPEAEASTDGEVEDQAPEEAPGAPAWREPQSKTDLYAKDAEVTHKGARWRSTIDGNRTEPGADSNWVKV